MCAKNPSVNSLIVLKFIERQKANRRSTVDKNQNKRQRETEDTGWQSAARSGSEWQLD